MRYKHKCVSVKELLNKLEEIISQIQHNRTILVNWQEVKIPDETILKVRFKEEGLKRQLKIKIEWEEEIPEE